MVLKSFIIYSGLNFLATSISLNSHLRAFLVRNCQHIIKISTGLRIGLTVEYKY
jgi:hypothetical protein